MLTVISDNGGFGHAEFLVNTYPGLPQLIDLTQDQILYEKSDFTVSATDLFDDPANSNSTVNYEWTCSGSCPTLSGGNEENLLVFGTELKFRD